MPITELELKQANADMLGNTNRGILFTTVNLSPDAPRLSNHLPEMVAGTTSWEQFNEMVRQKLTVRTFPEFLEKFQPCFYYRLAPPPQVLNVDLDAEQTAVYDDIDIEGEVTLPQQPDGDTDTVDGSAELDSAEFAMANALPEYEFSLEGGPAEQGWKRVLITLDHPLFKNLALSLKERALSSKTTANISVDDALWGFKPQMAESVLRKSAQEFRAISKKLALETRRNPNSTETRNALDAYDRKLTELENAVGDDLRVLPTIASGLAMARKTLGTGTSVSAGPALGGFMLEMGDRANVIAKPLPPTETLKQLEAAKQEDLKALPSGSTEIVSLRQALESKELSERKVGEIVKLPEEKQYPALIGSLMHDMIRRHKIQPVVGNMLSVILQDPQELANWNIAPREVEVFHDTFLGIYSIAVENFFKTIVPMFETLMGVYALFNEFPSDLRRGQPELIVVNDELSDLWRVYNNELSTFLLSACQQASNQYRDAISFALVPSVAPFKNRAPASPPSVFIRAGQFIDDYHEASSEDTQQDVSALRAEFDALRHQEARGQGGFGRIAGAPEVMGLMQLGKECGFSVFFSPERLMIAGRADAADVETLQQNYCPDTVVEKPWAVSGVLCLPDFVVLPPDGMMFIGKVMDGRPIGVEVPQIVVRSCYVAMGRYMANDNPEVLASKVNRLPPQQRIGLKVRPNLPGLSVDLTRFTLFGETNLAPDHFLSDRILRALLKEDRSFLVFAHVQGQSPFIAVPRTLKRERTDIGERYVLLHHWRQQLYLSRLLYAAYFKGRAGEWPAAAQMVPLMDKIINWMDWYDKNREGYVNSFPSELSEDTIGVTPVTEAGEIVSYIINLPLKKAVIGPLEISIE